MSDDKKQPYKVGYGKPPKEGRFEKGHCPNPKGRPPKRQVALIPREARNAILRVGSMPLKVNTPNGSKEVAAVEAVMLALLQTAMKGQYSSGRLFLDLYREALEQHFAAHPSFALLEANEKRAVVEDLDPWELQAINRQRRRTRRV